MEIKEIYTGPLFVKTWVAPLHDETMLVVDPGGADEELVEFLKSKNTKKLEIMLTHGHFDHVGGIPELIMAYPNSSIWIHRLDAHYLGNNAKQHHIECLRPIRAERYVSSLKYDFPDATNWLNDGDYVNGFKVIHTPGHTEGSVCFWKEDEKFIFSGDTLFYRSYGRTDLIGGSDEKLIKSLKSLLFLPDDTAVYPGHGSNTTIGAERMRLENL